MNLGIVTAAKGLLRPIAMRGVLAAASVGVLPAAAMAHPHFHFDDVHVDLRVAPVVVDRRIAPPPPPVEQREVRVWVEPVYRTVTERQWVEPVYRSVDDRSIVPDRFEWRDLVHIGHYGRRYIVRERVLVEPAHQVVTTRQVLVSDGHYEDVQRQELVTPGHYETRVQTEELLPG